MRMRWWRTKLAEREALEVILTCPCGTRGSCSNCVAAFEYLREHNPKLASRIDAATPPRLFKTLWTRIRKD